MIKNPYLRLMRVDRPVGSVLLLIPTLMALLLAQRGFPILYIIYFTIGVFLTRSAGCVMNDIADRDFDKHVSRTKQRPITSGEISVNKALILFFGLALLGIALLVFCLPYSTYIWAGMSVVLMVFYPFSKRIVKIPQIFLALAYSMPIPMAYAAINLYSVFDITCWLLFAANCCWVMAYDTHYALADREDDLKLGKINSSAIYFGSQVRLWILIFSYATIGFMVALGWLNDFTEKYYIGIALCAILFTEQVILVKIDQPQTAFHAFNYNQLIGLIMLISVATQVI